MAPSAAPLQFDVCQTSGGTLVVVVQSDLLEEIGTRVVMPLVADGSRGRGLKTLNPRVEIEGKAMLLLPQQLATVRVRDLGQPVVSLEHERDRITRALDALLSGV